MKRDKVLALILAGGEGGRLDVLTANRAKPALPFAGTLRLIDFGLSNCLHSGLKDVWVIEQYELHTLNDHLANGRPWDLDRTYGGLQVLPPSAGRGDAGGKDDGEGGFAEGNADAIYRQKQLIREFAPDLLLVLSADHVYRLDFRDVLDRHRACGADVTMVTTRVPAGDSASRFGVVEVDGDGRVTSFAYKPKQPAGDLVTAEIFVYDAPKLLKMLDELAADGGKLKDYGDELLPRFVKQGRVYEFRLESYWRDVGTLESYWMANMETLDRPEALSLDDPAWPILTHGSQRLPARVSVTASIDNSAISPGCQVGGEVMHSILGPGVIVEAGSSVRDSVLLTGCTVRAGARIHHAILDENVQVGTGAFVEGAKDDLCVIGQRVEIKPGTHLAPGAHLEPPENPEPDGGV